jgi:trehalose 6-phosphate synthase/phosphatase
MRLVIVSNRLPFTVSFQEGRPRFAASAGGLTTGLWSYLDRCRKDPSRQVDFRWVGWPGTSVGPQQATAVSGFGETHYNSCPVFLAEESMDRFYLGFCNRTLFHHAGALRGGGVAGIPARQSSL